jgi:hypothetical protein
MINFAVILCVILALVILASMWLAKHKRRPLLRLVAICVGLAGLISLAFINGTHKGATQAILLTHGYSPDSLQALLSNNLEEEVPVFVHGDAQPVPAGAIRIASPAMLRLQEPGVQHVHVIGHGLPAQSLQELKGLSIYAQLNRAKGITESQWTSTVQIGENFEVKGQWFDSQLDSVKVLLEVAGALEDSVKLAGREGSLFTLRYSPRLTGNFVYRLLAVTPDTFSYEMPVQVKESRALRVLIITSSPGFEVRFLKDYLASLQHQVTVWTKISQDIWQQEWVNRSPLRKARLSDRILAGTDIILMDEGYRNSLSGREMEVLQRAVQERGLGLLTWTDNSSGGVKDLGNDPIKLQRSQGTSRPVKLTILAREESISYEAPPGRIESATGLQPWLKDENNLVLSAGRRQGRGIEGFSVVPDTYTWFLQGDSTYYAAYWATVLSKLSAGLVSENAWYLSENGIAFPHKAVPLVYEGQFLPVQPSVQGPQGAREVLNMQQDVLLPYRYTASFTPQEPGWHHVTTDSLELSFYVHHTHDWAQKQARYTYSTTVNWLRDYSNSNDEVANTKPFRLPLIIPFILFVLAAGMLWLEEKL